MKVPKIIHQVWEGLADPIVPIRFQILADTWKKHNPEWEYRLWDNQQMNALVKDKFPDYWPIYNSFKYSVQRWDTIRYMILYVYGGVYVDLDTECFKNIDELFSVKENPSVYIGLEPPEHILCDYPVPFVGNAFMASAPGEKIWLRMLQAIVENLEKYKDITRKGDSVMRTTGPLMVSEVVASNPANIELLSSTKVAPITKADLIEYIGNRSDVFESKILDSYCAHYFFGSWETKFSIYKTYTYD